jgi:hypothetical protein
MNKVVSKNGEHVMVGHERNKVGPLASYKQTIRTENGKLSLGTVYLHKLEVEELRTPEDTLDLEDSESL